MKKIVLLLTCILACTYVQAQGKERDDSQDDINAIKRDTSFIYAESTMRDALEALSGAKAILELKLYDWLRYNYPDENAEMRVSDSKNKWITRVTNRGIYNRVFVYINKRDVISDTEQTDSIEEVADFVMKDITTPALTSDEETMAAIFNFSEIEPYVKSLKSERRIHAYGKYASLPVEDPCYMFVYNKEGSVIAVLRQSEDGKQINLRTLKDDNVRNYKNCGAIWLQFK